MNPSPWLAMWLGRELDAHDDIAGMEILAGPEAIDIARMAGLQLHRAPARKGDQADTAPSAADDAITGGADPFDFYLDLINLKPQEAADIILCLLGMFHAEKHYAAQ